MEKCNQSYLLSNKLFATVPGAISPAEFPISSVVEYGPDYKVNKISINYVPTLEAEITLVGEQFHLTWNSDMTDKEGYAKVYIDGDEAFELKNNEGIALDFDAGSFHNVVIKLFKNDGTPYNVNKV